MNTRIELAEGSRDAGLSVGALVQLSKPGVTRAVLATAFCGAVIAPGPVNYGLLVGGLTGTALVVAAANALNMYFEADVDALMDRTRTRPIPSGRISGEVAVIFGALTGALGLVTLAFGVNLLTAALGLLALLSYVFLYTPLKRVSPLAVYVGALPGAAPPLMGWTSMTGELTPAGLSLFALLFIWQIPHFHAIAIFRSRDYEKAGLEVLPVKRGIEYTKFSIALLLIVQLFVSALPAFAGLGGPLYLTVATALGVMYVGWGLAGLRPGAGARWARSLFFVSMPYLLVLFAALVIDAQ